MTASVWLTDVLIVAGRGSGRVSSVLTTLEDLAAREADAARDFHRRVAAQMVPIIVALGLAVSTVLGIAVWLPDYGAWLVSPNGQLISLASTGVIALICTPMFSSASAMLRA